MGMSIASEKAGGLHSQRRPGFAELYLPKLVTVWREGYGLSDLRADVIAGLTVAIVALPLSMAIAIASGVEPGRGLYTSVIGGFVVSLIGGSRFQIGGPAGAFIVLVAVTVDRHGVDGVILATLMAGIILVAAGFLRIGTYIKFIPYPVTVGFTAGIAVIIFASQLKDLLGCERDAEEILERFPSPRCRRCCPMRSPLRCSPRSSRCSRRWSPTA
jgi:SulP family sulfate permease